jgi:hypothetical protein
MSDRLLVGTHKGLFEFDWDDRAPLAMDSSRTHFLGEPVTMTLEDPRDGTLYAALNLGHFGVKLHRRLAGSRDWEECAVPVYPLQPAHNGTTENGSGEAQAERPDATTVPSWTLEQIWSLEAGGPDEPGVLWAGTIPGGLFCSNDGGETWTLNRPLWDRPERSEWMGGGYDHPGIHSVIVDPRDSRHVTVGVSTGGVWQTYDGGASWRLTALGMQADYMPPERARIRTFRTRTASCIVRRSRTHCGRSITARFFDRRMPAKLGSASRRNRRISASLSPSIREMPKPLGLCRP